MDINCGGILDGVSIALEGLGILNEIIALASKQQTLFQEPGMGGTEFVPRQIGAVM